MRTVVEAYLATRRAAGFDLSNAEHLLGSSPLVVPKVVRRRQFVSAIFKADVTGEAADRFQSLVALRHGLVSRIRSPSAVMSASRRSSASEIRRPVEAAWQNCVRCRHVPPRRRLSPRRNPHSCGTTAVPNPRFPALALFGRRPSECVERPSFRRPKTCTKADLKRRRLDVRLSLSTGHRLRPRRRLRCAKPGKKASQAKRQR
jgi:hypothetical protein